jgi:gas vesicle protein
MRKNNAGAVVGAFLGGAIVGGVIALLFAPKSGAETREAIRDFAQEELDMLRDRTEAARDYVEDEIDRYKKKARRGASQIAEMVEDVKDCVRAEKEKLAHL